jgi:hypothetical protein
MNQQANEYLKLAIEGSSIDMIKKTLQDGADVNLFCKDGSLVHSAIMHEKDDFIKILVESGADLNRVNKKFNTASGLAVCNKLFNIANYLLKERKSFDRHLFTDYVDICVNNYSLKGGEEAGKLNQRLLTHYASRLTGVNVGRLLNRTDRSITDVYLVHLLEYAYAEKHNKKLEGWDEQQFLSLRIHAFLELLVKLKRGVIQTHHEEEYKRVNVIEHLENELLHEIETLRTIKDRNEIHYSSFSDTEKEELYKTLAKRVVNHIVNLEVGNSYTQDSGWPTHNIYVNFTKTKENIILVRVDNLGTGLDNHDENEQGLVAPVELSVICTDDTSEIEALENYILLILKGKNNWYQCFALSNFSTEEVERLKELIGASLQNIQALELTNDAYKSISFEQWEIADIEETLAKLNTEEADNLIAKLIWKNQSRAIAEETIYDKEEKTIRKYLGNSADYRRLPAQTSANCVLAAYQVGLLIRSYEPEFYEWLLCEEKTIVINPRRAKYTKEMDHDYYWNNQDYLVKNNPEFNIVNLCSYYQYSEDDLLINLPEFTLDCDDCIDNTNWDLDDEYDSYSLAEGFNENNPIKTVMFSFLNKNYDSSLKQCEDFIKQLTAENEPTHTLYLLKAYLTFLMIEYKLKEPDEYKTVIDSFEQYHNVHNLKFWSPNLLFMLATAYGKWGELINNFSYHIKARDTFLKLISEGKPDPELRAAAYYSYGTSLQKLGDNSKATFEYKKARKIYEDTMNKLNTQAESKKHCELTHKYADVLHNLGFSHYLSGEIQDAVNCFPAQSKLKINYLFKEEINENERMSLLFSGKRKNFIFKQPAVNLHGCEILREKANQRITNITFGLGLVGEKAYRDSDYQNINAKNQALKYFQQVISRDAGFEEAKNHIEEINKIQPKILQETGREHEKRKRMDAGLEYDSSTTAHKKAKRTNKTSNLKFFKKVAHHKTNSRLDNKRPSTSFNSNKGMGQ